MTCSAALDAILTRWPELIALDVAYSEILGGFSQNPKTFSSCGRGTCNPTGKLCSLFSFAMCISSGAPRRDFLRPLRIVYCPAWPGILLPQMAPLSG